MGSSLKVAFVTSGLSRRGGGVSAVVEDLSRALLNTGLDVAVFGLRDEDWAQSQQRIWRGAPATALPVVGPVALGYAPDMLRQLHAWKPDIVHLHGLWTHASRSVLQWARATGKPYIVSPHGMLAPAALAFSPMKKKLVEALYQQRASANAECVHVTCQQELDEVRAHGLTQPAVIIPNGIDLPSLAEDLERPMRRSVISLGRIHPKKGLDRLVRAWSLIEPQFPHWRLDIVGPDEGGHALELERLAHELGLKNVLVDEPVYGDDKWRRLRQAEVFALPTLNENFALSVAESLACCTPVISTIGAPWQGLKTHGCGWWIEHGVEPLAETLKTAMSLSDGKRRAMGAAGRAWMAKDFSWPVIAQQFAAAYDGIADRKPVHAGDDGVRAAAIR